MVLIKINCLSIVALFRKKEHYILSFFTFNVVLLEWKIVFMRVGNLGRHNGIGENVLVFILRADRLMADVKVTATIGE